MNERTNIHTTYRNNVSIPSFFLYYYIHLSSPPLPPPPPPRTLHPTSSLLPLYTIGIVSIIIISSLILYIYIILCLADNVVRRLFLYILKNKSLTVSAHAWGVYV